jgi:hypothetical protein
VRGALHARDGTRQHAENKGLIRRSPRAAILGAVASLLLRIMALVAILVGAVVATAQTRAWWTVALAVAGLVLAAAAVGASLRGLLGRDADAEPEAWGRGRVAALTAVAAVAVVLAIALPVEDSAATSTARPSAAGAAQTVRDFLASAVLDDSAYSACQYLTPAAQQRVARMAGDGQTCRDALTATRPSFAGIQSEGALHALGLRAVARGGTAYVTALPRDRRPVTFVLRRTTPMQAAGYEAPPAAWRIAGGATSVLRP